LRARSYSRFLTQEAARLLEAFGAETRIFDPRDLPLPDAVSADHPKVQELRALSLWSEGHVWCSPERHGAISGVMKAQIDWIPLETGGVRPTQGRTLAVMQVSGGSQSFNAVNTLRLLGRWMRMITIPNQSSVAKAFQEFDEAGRMKPSPYYDRVVDVMEELVKFTWLTRDVASYLTNRYSERKEDAVKLEARVRLNAI
jgi:arsenic resistance protein ArsH